MKQDEKMRWYLRGKVGTRTARKVFIALYKSTSDVQHGILLTFEKEEDIKEIPQQCSL
ncbi:hypothetical protein ZHAS_00011645 [Anopheles sinensis]|uniref:Uncharacterized protein n=1 Tax=Anopheles sinensis TaxID=74873 RepID=A0A084W0N4_ANOSI|nr:hypothetical protein ZHAS_00011645 [Anopheles sinensis]